MSGNKSMRNHFKKNIPVQRAPAQTGSQRQTTSASTDTIVVSVPQTRYAEMGQSKSTVSKNPSLLEYSSSLSLPPPTSSAETDYDHENVGVGEEPSPLPSAASNESARRIIKSSDDEDSDSSLEDLAIILSTDKIGTHPMSSLTGPPKTPSSSRYVKTNFNFHTSPLAVLPKSQFDMKSLISHAQNDNAAEASSKRVKAMMAPQKELEHGYLAKGKDANKTKFAHSALLESVVAEQEGGMAKVTRALMRTEATVIEKRWYFFDTQSKRSQVVTKPFPKGAALLGWEGELKDPRVRRQSFISGFVEDMVGLGKQLPDELFLWILEEAFSETCDPLRISYLNALQDCPEQICRLLVPDIVPTLFQRLGATEPATTNTQKVIPAPPLLNPYPNYDWSRIRSVVNFLGRIGDSLQQNSRTYIVCMILRMSVDRAVLENVDLLVEVQRAIYYLCGKTPDNDWESTCTTICKSLLTTVLQPTFRLQVVESITSGSPRTHDLRRRLAMCFFFNDISYSRSHPYKSMDIGRFIERLHDADFDARPQTEYPELTALVLLLDIAVDDGRSAEADLSKPENESKFNADVDNLVANIKDIMTSIGNPGAAFISRIEAKEALELISQRIADTVRTKKVIQETWLDRNRGRDQDDLHSERKGMSKFLTKMHQIKKGVDKPAIT